MSWKPPQDDDRPPVDPLDALLAQAQWGPPQRERVARLQSLWARLVAARRRRNLARLAVAATVLAAAGLTIGHLVRQRRDPHEAAPVAGNQPDRSPAPETGNAPPEVAQLPAPAEPVEEHSVDRPVPSADQPAERPTQPIVAAAAPPLSRAPNSFELLALAAADRGRDPFDAGSGQDEPDLSADLQAAVDRLTDADSPGLSPEEFFALLETLRPGRAHHIARLESLLSDPADPAAVAAVRLLAELAGVEALPALRPLVKSPGTRDAAIDALGRLESPLVVASLARQQRNLRVRRLWLAALVARPEVEAASAVMELLRDPLMRQETLQSLAAATHPATEAFFGWLTGPQPDERVWAALALAWIDGPAVTHRLIELVQLATYRQDALLSLVASRGAEAQWFVAAARSDEQLLASTLLAERRLLELYSPLRRSMP